MKESTPSTLSKRRYLYALTGIIPVMVLVAVFIFTNIQKANALDGDLVVYLTSPSGEPLNAYNLIVDSNATNATSTAAPNVATVAARFCNESGSDLTNLWGYIGDGTTAGSYPTKNAASFSGLPGTPFAEGGGDYAFRHMGATSDASRFIGTLADGECSVQYWHFTYPQCENLTTAVPGDPYHTPPCNAYGAQSATWGDSVNPNDDMSLDFTVWGTSTQDDDSATWTMHMRNEISAMANKIKPNPDGIWFNTDTSTVYPGETITTNGVLYEFGNINQGFDNDGDGMPDYNAWAQPIGNPSYDPSCFRLVKTETVLTVSRSGGLGVLTLNYTDQLYYTNLPSNNTGVRGVVEYTFLALGGACFSGLSPYQEVASGSDNEKFNGDYGTGVPPLQSYESEVGIDKSSSPATVPLGSTTTYQIPFWNDGTKDAGLFLSAGDPLNSPLVIKDVVPDGMQYVCTSAQATTQVAAGVTIYYSNDNGASWSTDEISICSGGNPLSTAGGSEVVIQWWLNGTLPAGATGVNNYAEFDATVPLSYPPASPNFIENCATSHFGPNGPAFDEACATIMIPGANTLGDFVWRDLNNDGIQDGGNETGIDGVLVTLYYDANSDGILDDNEKTPVASMETSGGGAYDFTQLPDAHYIVVVDTEDTSIPTGYYPSPYSSPVTQYAVDLNLDPGDIDYNDADFGFAPSVNFDKVLDTANPSYEGDIVRYSINVTNNRIGNGEPPGSCVYNVWGQTAVTGTGGTAWTNPLNAEGVPDGLYATGLYAGNGEFINLTNFTGATVGGTITQVYVAVPIAVLPALAGDLEIEILDSADVLIGTMQVRDAASLSDGILYIDVTTIQTWLPADFAPGALTTKIQLTTRKTANPSGDLYVDAVGYRVTTSETCGNPSDTISSLPLTDTFDNTKLQFESANPPVTSVSGGTLTWENVGPIYAGQTKSIIVRFVALQPPDGEPDPTTHTNCSATTGGTYRDGALVNDGADCVTHGINPGGEIGDLVWYNSTVNGVQDPGEYGLGNVIVNLCTDALCANIIKTTSTDATGYYLFKGVPDGTSYYVQVDTATLPAGGTWTNNWDDDCGVAPCGNDTSGVIIIDSNDGSSANDDYYGADFGYVTAAPMLIGSVWHDRNNSGTTTPDLNEEGLEGLTIALQSGNCKLPPETSNPCPTTETDPSGDFTFTGLATNTTYEVYVYTGSGPISLGTWTQTFDTDGVGVTDDPVPPAVPINNGSVVNGGVNLSNGVLYRVDFSYRNADLLNIGDTIFTDWNGDAIQDTGEEGISGVTVTLYRDLNGNGQVDASDILSGTLGTDVTDSNGNYLFTGYPGGTDYLVVVDASTLPTSYVQTLDPTGGAGVVCILCDNMGVLSNLSATNLDQDFAYKPTGTGSIGDFVWKDVDGDGLYDPSGRDGIPGNSDDETPIASVTVSLHEDQNGNGVVDPEDALIGTAETDSNGNYLFTGLPTDNKNYIVQVVDTTAPPLPVGFTYPSTPTIVAVNLTNADPEYLDADFGFTGPASVGDYIWIDSNGDGEQDPTESGINGVTVALHTFTYVDGSNGGVVNGIWDWVETKTLGAVVTTMGTVAGATGDGYYLFDNLAPGDYAVVVNTASAPLANHTNTGDPDAIACNPGCDNETYFYIAPGQADLTRDFGYRPEVEISGTFFFDSDNNGGTYNSGVTPDNPYANITVYLDDGVCTIGTDCPETTTDENGFYQFYVPNGGGGTSYTIRYDTTAPSLQGMNKTSEPDDTTCTVPANCNGETTVTVVGNTPETDLDFGFFANMDCGDLSETNPNGFSTSLSRNGACHVIGDHYLGALIDSEVDGQEDPIAGSGASGGDDNDGTDDEDGVNRNLADFWTPGATVNLNVDAVGANAYLVGWIDWNGDGIFGAGEMIDFGSVSEASTQSLNVTVPSSGYTTGTPIMARFRLYDGTPASASPSGQTNNGEVEDYYWEFGPTAVSMQSFNTNTPSDSVNLITITGLLMVVTAGMMIFLRRRNRGV